MSQSILGNRGCVYRFGDQDTGLYALTPRILFPDDGGYVLLQSVTVQDGDIVQPVSTLESSKILYTFGREFGQVSIGGVCLLGDGDGKAFSVVTEYYNVYHVDRYGQAIQVSLPGDKAYNIYLIGLTVGVPDPQFNLQPFAFTGLIADT